MRVLWFILVINVIRISCDNGSGQTEYIELDPTPFEVPPAQAERGARIVFGNTAASGQFKHFALIFVKRPTATVQCGAGLVATTWALTADHCIRNATQIELRFGLTYRESFNQRLYAQALARQTDADIALIKLKNAVTVNSLVRPALLPRASQRSELFVNRIATICGMGIENQQTNSVSNYLKYADLTIMSQAACAPYFGNVDSRMLCGKSSTSLASSCAGDSGSPLIIYENGQPVIVGVVSFGAASGCDRGYPVGYGRTTMQLDWITYFIEVPLRP